MIDNCKNIVFDLDGTIIDSYEGIQNSFDFGYQQIYKEKNNIDILPLIGPPIKDILVKAKGENDAKRIKEFVHYFKTHYDSIGYKFSKAYKGTENVLKKFIVEGYSLFICTNKRHVATLKVLQEISFDHYFKKIYSIDSESIFFKNKSELLMYILTKESLNINETVFVGDTKDDAEAALNNNLKFVYCSFGYGTISNAKITIDHISELVDMISNHNVDMSNRREFFKHNII